MTDETTGPKVAAIAGKVLALDDEALVAFAREAPHLLRALAASALTQAPDTTTDGGLPSGDRKR